MEYLVTGATGFVGGTVARHLLAAGLRVRALVRSPDRARGLAAEGARLEPGDVTDRESVARAMEGVDGVFHLAGWYKVGVRDKSPGRAINVEGTRNVLEAMRDLRVPKGVYTSTLAVFGDTRGKLLDETFTPAGPWPSEYDRSKWEAHYAVAGPMIRKGLPLVIVLPGVVYGPGDTSQMGAAFADYLQGRLKYTPAGAAYCWAHADDVARGHLLAMEKGKPGESYILAGPPHSLVDAFAIGERVTGVPAPTRHPSPRTLRLLSRVMGAVEKVVPVRDALSSESLRVMAGVTYLGDSAKARRELGYTCRPLEEGLRGTLRHEMARLRIAPREGAR